MQNTGESIDMEWGKIYRTQYYKIITNKQSYCKISKFKIYFYFQGE